MLTSISTVLLHTLRLQLKSQNIGISLESRAPAIHDVTKGVLSP